MDVTRFERQERCAGADAGLSRRDLTRMRCCSRNLRIFLGGARRAESQPTRARVSKQELQAKIAYCENCHGVSAQGFHGYYPIPRLAGQQPEYLKNQLQAFVERRRTNNIMFNVCSRPEPGDVGRLLHDKLSQPQSETAHHAPLLRTSLPRGRKSTKREYRNPTFRRAPPVTARRRRATDNFPAWPVSSATTSSTN